MNPFDDPCARLPWSVKDQQASQVRGTALLAYPMRQPLPERGAIVVQANTTTDL